MRDPVKIFTELPFDSGMLTYVSYAVRKRKLNEIPCRESSFIPGNRWRKLDESQIHDIFHTLGQPYPFQSIALVALKPDFVKHNGIDKLRQICNGEITEEIELSTQKAVAALESYSAVMRREDAHSGVQGLHIAEPSQTSATFNTLTGSYIGLHLDSWFPRPVCERALSANRICFNLGYDTRYLIFVNVPIAQIRFLVQLEKSEDTNFIIKKYLGSYPEIMIYRLRIRPFEGYIFPTENLIHDGRTRGLSYHDITYTQLGFYHLEDLFSEFQRREDA